DFNCFFLKIKKEKDFNFIDSDKNEINEILRRANDNIFECILEKLKNYDHLKYGMTETKKNEIINHYLFKPHSEVVLTFLTLVFEYGWNKNLDEKNSGNNSQWPRKNDEKWNQNFFENGAKAIMFEFQLPNNEFTEAFFGKKGENNDEPYSFLKPQKNWSQFDAFYIDKENNNYIFYEAKLTSDIDSKTTKYSMINQIQRNLEAIYHFYKNLKSGNITTDKDKLKYIFICPREYFECNARYYAHFFDNNKKFKIGDFIRNFERIYLKTILTNIENGDCEKLKTFHDEINAFKDFLKDNLTIELKFWEDYLDLNNNSCVFKNEEGKITDENKKYSEILYNRFKEAAYD
ncbi:MAG: hypothetical protein M0Q02_13380, partial [Candidatus Muirbacterium halophilum]|nr:hypothetical protein [Candidatus Muirbacterium halophilum]